MQYVAVANRRSCPRVPASGLGLIAQSGFLGNTLEVVDLSATGARLQTHHLPPLPRSFLLVIALPTGWVEARGELAWREDRETRTLIGVRIEPLRLGDRVNLERAVEQVGERHAVATA